MNVNETLIVALVGILSLGLAYFTYFLSRYTEKVTEQIKNIKDDGKRKIFENALRDFHDIVLKTVTYTEQVVIKDLKEQSKDGVISKEDLKKVAEDALQIVLNAIEPKTKDVLQKNINDLEKYAVGAIETRVYAIKNK